MQARKDSQVPLYVKLPSEANERLQHAAQTLGVPKKRLVAELVTKYIDADPHRPVVGTYSFRTYDPPEVMNAEQAGAFLQISEKEIIALAESSQLPGRKLGTVWRFSREGLVAWLAAPQSTNAVKLRKP